MAKILISYRRSDTAASVGRIYDRLAAYYGKDQLFLDVDDIPKGADFRHHIAKVLSHTDVVLAIIGTRWLGVNAEGVRLHREDDPVRVEIESTQASKTPLLPVLIDGAAMPLADELPSSLQTFPYLNAAAVSSGVDFDQHVARLIRAIDTLLGAKAPAAPLQRAASARPAWRAAFPYFALLALALPFAAARAGFTPPWPHGVQIITALVEGALIVGLTLVLRHVSVGAVKRGIIASTLLLAVCAVAYLGMGSAFTYVTPATGEHWVKGYVCTSDAMLLYKDKCPFLGNDELRGAEYEAERLWTVPSIAVVKVTLASLWFLAFVSIAALAAFSGVDRPRSKTFMAS